MNKVLFFDIDGTLAIHGKIPQSNLDALSTLQKKGYLTFICTGRAPFYAQKMFGHLVSGIISCNGRYINYQNKKLYGKELLPKEIDTFKEIIKEANCGALFVSDYFSYPYHLDDTQIDELFEEYGKSRIKDIKDKFYTLDLFYKTLEERDELVNRFKNILIINDHGSHGSCDCSTLNFDKGNAIAYILDYFSLTPKDAYAFGDGYNDLSMFREVDHRIAMGNAVKELKEKATYITDSIENDGITKALIRENLISFKRAEIL